MNCPKCGNPVKFTISTDESFTIDTMGTLGFCISENTIYVHVYEHTKTDDFSRFSKVAENVDK
jgi:hypothetical protein